MNDPQVESWFEGLAEQFRMDKDSGYAFQHRLIWYADRFDAEDRARFRDFLVEVACDRRHPHRDIALGALEFAWGSEVLHQLREARAKLPLWQYSHRKYLADTLKRIRARERADSEALAQHRVDDASITPPG